MKPLKVLIMDDDVNILKSLEMVLHNEIMDVVLRGDGSFDASEIREADVMLLDVYLGNRKGQDVLKDTLEKDPFLPVVMISGLTGVDEALECTRLGAFDFIEKPLKVPRLILTIKNAARFRSLRRETLSDTLPSSRNPDMLTLFSKARKVAVTDMTVLITGESGTGKDVLARYIHALSPRFEAGLFKLNCSAIPESLAESELFGHRKGSFTGAITDYEGKIMSADGGTLFLDEIGDLPAGAQAKLLRFLENREIQRVGDTRIITADTRIIAATNKNLEILSREGKFREDLFYRLNVIPLRLPPLRERKEDIPLLTDHLIVRFCREQGIRPPELAVEVYETLSQMELKGNIRELKSILEQAVIFSGTGNISPGDIRAPAAISDGTAREPAHQETAAEITDLFTTPCPLRDAKRKLELLYLSHWLRKNDGSVTKTAESLEILPNNLTRRLKSLREGFSTEADYFK